MAWGVSSTVNPAEPMEGDMTYDGSTFSTWPTDGTPNTFTWANGAFVGIVAPAGSDYGWLCPHQTNHLVRYHKVTGAMNAYDLASVTGYNNLPDAGCVYDANTKILYTVPNQGNRIISMDVSSPATPTVGTIYTTPTGGSGAYLGGFVHNGYLWFGTQYAANNLRITLADGTKDTYTNFPGGLIPAWPAVTWFGTVFDGSQYAYLVPRAVDRVVRWDSVTPTNSMDGYLLPTSPLTYSNSDWKFYGGTWDGSCLWMAPATSDHILILCGSTFTQENSWPIGFYEGGGATPIRFRGASFDGKYVWFTPYLANQLVRADVSTKALKGFEIWTYNGRLLSNKYSGMAVDFETKSLWLAPYSTLIQPEGIARIRFSGTAGGVQSFISDSMSSAGIYNSNGVKSLDEWATLSFQTFSIPAVSSGAQLYVSPIATMDAIWLIPKDATSLAKFDKATETMTMYSSYPSPVTGGTSSKFSGAAAAGIGGNSNNDNKLWLIPSQAGMVVEVDTTSGAMTKHDGWPGAITPLPTTGDCFVGGFVERTNLWMVPHEALRIVQMTTTSGAMTSLSTWPTGFTYSARSFHGVIFNGFHGYCIPCESTSYFVRFNVHNSVMEQALGAGGWPGSFTPGTCAFKSGALDSSIAGSNGFWLAPYDANMIVHVHEDTGVASGYNSWPVTGSNTPDGNYPFTPGRFLGTTFDGKYMWLAPDTASHIIRLDPAGGGGSMIALGYWGSGVPQPNYYGISFDPAGASLYLAPFSGATGYDLQRISWVTPTATSSNVPTESKIPTKTQQQQMTKSDPLPQQATKTLLPPPSSDDGTTTSSSMVLAAPTTTGSQPSSLGLGGGDLATPSGGPIVPSSSSGGQRSSLQQQQVASPTSTSGSYSGSVSSNSRPTLDLENEIRGGATVSGENSGIFRQDDGSMSLLGIVIVILLLGLVIHALGFLVYFALTRRRSKDDDEIAKASASTEAAEEALD